jgi:hypothetical protein
MPWEGQPKVKHQDSWNLRGFKGRCVHRKSQYLSLVSFLKAGRASATTTQAEELGKLWSRVRCVRDVSPESAATSAAAPSGLRLQSTSLEGNHTSCNEGRRDGALCWVCVWVGERCRCGELCVGAWCLVRWIMTGDVVGMNDLSCSCAHAR